MKTDKSKSKKKGKVPAASSGKIPSAIKKSAGPVSGKKSKKKIYDDKTLYNFSYFLKIFG